MFSSEAVARAKTYTVEQDEVMPGTWHVFCDEHEFRVQTDEEPTFLWTGDKTWIDIRWATCTCDEGMASWLETPRCGHVAAVVMRIVGKL